MGLTVLCVSVGELHLTCYAVFRLVALVLLLTIRFATVTILENDWPGWLDLQIYIALVRLQKMYVYRSAAIVGCQPSIDGHPGLVAG